MDYSALSRPELIALCKERGLKGYGTKRKEVLVAMLGEANTIVEATPVAPVPRQDILHGDSLELLPTLAADSAQSIIADPPYNIGKDFGNDSDKQPMEEYLVWCERWIKECLRILKPNGTMFIYGFSEILALISSKVPFVYEFC